MNSGETFSASEQWREAERLRALREMLENLEKQK
jgi:hypothetical protein